MDSAPNSGTPEPFFRPSAEDCARTKRHRKPKRSEMDDLLARYQPFEHQRKFHDSPAKYRLFGGAAGPGKTKALLWEAIRQAHRVPGSDSLLLRRTYPELESSLLAQFRRDVPKHYYKKFNETKYVVTWKNGSTTRFGYCRNEHDVYRYQGAEFLFIGFDELTHFTLKQWQFLTSRNRCPIRTDRRGRPVRPCMAGATNPGNIGHAWVKALWVDHTPPAGFDADGYDARDYGFIPARLADNPIYANDAEYRKTLTVLPEHLRKAFLEGDWNVFAGQYFDIFDYGRHTARPEEIRLEPWYPRWISVDWGFQHNSAVYWHCAIPAFDGGGILSGAKNLSSFSAQRDPSSVPEGDNSGARIVTYREFVQNGLSPRMLAQAIAERSGREHISEVFLSPDAFAHRTAESSIAEQLGDVLAANALPRPAPADDDRIGGWQFVYQLLESDAWLITENCDKLIACLPTLVRDHTNVEDIRKMDGDDPADAARYGLVSGGRFASVGAGFMPPRATHGSPSFGRGAQLYPAQLQRNAAPHPGHPEEAGAQFSAGGGISAPLQGDPRARTRQAEPGSSLSAMELEGLRSARPGSGAAAKVRAGSSLTGGAKDASPGAAARDPGAPHFVTGMPLDQQIARQINTTDPTSVAIHSGRLASAAKKHFRPKGLPRCRR